MSPRVDGDEKVSMLLLKAQSTPSTLFFFCSFVLAGVVLGGSPCRRFLTWEGQFS